jgi:glycerophosphoryl diester phosphodiesterase
MAHWILVTPGFWRAIRDAGGELYVWTVDDARRIAQLEALGVTGVITNDPRLFG